MVGFFTGVTCHQHPTFSASDYQSKEKQKAIVQCIPYKGLSDSKVHELPKKVIHEMVNEK